MAIKTFRAGRQNYAVETYVGVKGELYYVEDTGQFRLCDGVTPGGRIVGNLSIAEVGTTPPASPLEGELWYNPNTYELWVYHDGNFEPTIDLATETKIGGVKLGPGVTTNAEGQIIVDSSGLEFSFGDFTAIENRLSTVNPDEDIYIESNGTGNINLIGGVNFYKPNGFPPSVEPFFRATNDGQIRILVPTADINFGAVQIVGNNNGTTLPPRLAGVMLHITGNDGEISRVYNDGSGNNAAYVGRRYNGTSAAPTQVLAGQSIMRITAVGHDDTEMPLDGTASIFFDALQNFTTTARGSQLKFQTTPLNGTTREFVATMDSQNGITATKGYFRYDVANGNATATQQTSKSTAVTCNGRTGQITTSNESLAKGSSVTFTVNNNFVTAVTDIPVVVIQSGATLNSYAISVTRVQVNSFNITITNNGTGPLSDVLVINFAIIKVS